MTKPVRFYNYSDLEVGDKFSLVNAKGGYHSVVLEKNEDHLVCKRHYRWSGHAAETYTISLVEDTSPPRDSEKWQ